MAKYEEWLTEEGLIKIEGWARDGLTNEQISHNMGINPDTLYTWIKKYPEVSDSLKRGKEVVDRQVENALLKSALGFEYEEEMVTNKGNVVKIKKYERPSNTAQIFWLKNRKPADWRDKQELNINRTEETDNEQNVNQLKELRKKVIDTLPEPELE
jgi:transposase-like protein